MPPLPNLPPFTQQWEIRPAIGTTPLSGANGAARTGGWIRPLDPQPIDAALVAQLTDAWLPAVFVRLTEPNAVPTIDLTIHFRADLPLPPDYVLATFESRVSQGLAWSSWLPALVVLLSIAGIATAPRATAGARQPRFAQYLVLVGLFSIAGYLFGRCGSV